MGHKPSCERSERAKSTATACNGDQGLEKIKIQQQTARGHKYTRQQYAHRFHADQPMHTVKDPSKETQDIKALVNIDH